MVGVLSTPLVKSELTQIPFLNGENFKDWKEKVLLVLGVMDLDLVFRIEEPAPLTEGSNGDEKVAYEKWERSNRLSLNLIKTHVNKSIRGSIPDCDKVKDYMKAIEEQFVSSDKQLASSLMNIFSSTKHDKSKSVREHIMTMRDTTAQLKELEIEISESFLVTFILNSLPTEYGPFKISYNTHKEKWSVNELLNMCVQEEERMKRDVLESANLASTSKGPLNKGKGVLQQKNENPTFKRNGDKCEMTCFFCKKKGHMKKACIKYKKWFEKRNGVSQPKETDGM